MPQNPIPVPQIIASSALGVGAIKPIAGTSYHFLPGDPGKFLRCTNGSAVTLTMDPDSITDLPVQALINIEQAGAGQVAIVAGAGVTIHSAGGLTHTAAQYAVISLIKIGANAWNLSGNLA